MFKTFGQLFKRSNKDLRKRIYFTLFCLAIFSFGSAIIVPWAKPLTEELGVFEIFNLMTGGGLKSFSIFALGVTPYINAQIITQLLQMDIIPYFKELKEEGYTGKQKINKITRYLGILLAFVQGYIFTRVYSGSTDAMLIMKTTVIFTARTSLL
jgi:preprotein translocase subunit SecY